MVALGCKPPAPSAGRVEATQTRASEVSQDVVSASAPDAAADATAELPVPGPTGTIEGVVLLDGPLPAPERLELPAAFQGVAGCGDAARRYAQRFDISSPGPFPGALVAAEARAPGLGPPVPRRLIVRDCDITPRFVFAKENDPVLLGTEGRRPHLPTIVGSGAMIDQLLIPGQPDRTLQFPSPGTYPVRIRDLPEFVGAMIYRLRQRFIDTTDVQGRFRIAEVPVGRVTVNAWYPGAIASQQVATVSAGQVARLEFHLVPAPVHREPVVGIRHPDGTVRTDSGVIIPQ